METPAEKEDKKLKLLLKRLYSTATYPSTRVELQELNVLLGLLIELLSAVGVSSIEEGSKIAAEARWNSPERFSLTKSLIGLTPKEFFNDKPQEIEDLLEGAKLRSYEETSKLEIYPFLMVYERDIIRIAEKFIAENRHEETRATMYPVYGEDEGLGFASEAFITLDLKNLSLHTSMPPGLSLFLNRSFSFELEAIKDPFFGLDKMSIKISVPLPVFLLPRESSASDSPFSFSVRNYIDIQESLRSILERKAGVYSLATASSGYYQRKLSGHETSLYRVYFLFSALIDYLTWLRHTETEGGGLTRHLVANLEPLLCLSGKEFTINDILGKKTRTIWDYIGALSEEKSLLEFFEKNKGEMKKRLLSREQVAIEEALEVLQGERGEVIRQAKRISSLLSWFSQRAVPYEDLDFVMNAPIISHETRTPESFLGKEVATFKTGVLSPVEVKVVPKNGREKTLVHPLSQRLEGQVELRFRS